MAIMSLTSALTLSASRAYKASDGSSLVVADVKHVTPAGRQKRLTHFGILTKKGSASFALKQPVGTILEKFIAANLRSGR
jgi:hypothetical protein